MCDRVPHRSGEGARGRRAGAVLGVPRRVPGRLAEARGRRPRSPRSLLRSRRRSRWSCRDLRPSASASGSAARAAECPAPPPPGPTPPAPASRRGPDGPAEPRCRPPSTAGRAALHASRAADRRPRRRARRSVRPPAAPAALPLRGSRLWRSRRAGAHRPPAPAAGSPARRPGPCAPPSRPPAGSSTRSCSPGPEGQGAAAGARTDLGHDLLPSGQAGAGLKDGTLKQIFREEVKKSYEEYVLQVGERGRDPPRSSRTRSTRSSPAARRSSDDRSGPRWPSRRPTSSGRCRPPFLLVRWARGRRHPRARERVGRRPQRLPGHRRRAGSAGRCSRRLPQGRRRRGARRPGARPPACRRCSPAPPSPGTTGPSGCAGAGGKGLATAAGACTTVDADRGAGVGRAVGARVRRERVHRRRDAGRHAPLARGGRRGRRVGLRAGGRARAAS